MAPRTPQTHPTFLTIPVLVQKWENNTIIFFKQFNIQDWTEYDRFNYGIIGFYEILAGYKLICIYFLHYFLIP